MSEHRAQRAPASSGRRKRRRRWAAAALFLALPLCAAFSALAPGFVGRALAPGAARSRAPSAEAPERARRAAPAPRDVAPPIALDHRPLEHSARFAADEPAPIARVADALHAQDVLQTSPRRPNPRRAAALQRAARAEAGPRAAIARAQAEPSQARSEKPPAPELETVFLETRPAGEGLPSFEPIASALPQREWLGPNDGFTESFEAPSVVPEPGTAWLLGAGVAALARRARLRPRRLRNG